MRAALVIAVVLVATAARAETDEQRRQRHRLENAQACQDLAFAGLHVEWDRSAGVCRVRPEPSRLA